MGQFSGIRNTAGVYLLLDLDGVPLYAGQSKHLRGRLEQHFIRQDSSATADGLLDIYDVLQVVVWYAYPKYELFAEDDASAQERMEPLDILEAAVVQRYSPPWNRAKTVAWAGPMPDLTIDNADVVVGILDSPEQVAVRREPLERIEAKLLHLIRAVRKAKISGASRGVRAALTRHGEELLALLEAYARKERGS
jgi:excinuclease UvrABC nuclease subunit